MPYALLVIATLFIDFAVNLPTGSLPLALSYEGAPASVVSVVMGTGMLAVLFGSVPIGVLVDRVGRLATIRWAALGTLIAMIALSGVHGAPQNAVVMVLRQLALVAYITSEFAYASEIVPEARRVSAVSTLGMIGNLSFAAAPALGVWLWQHGIGREQYAYAGILVVIGGAILFFLPRRHDVRTRRRSRRIIMRSAWLPAIAFIVATTIQGGVNGSLAVLTFTHRGIGNGALLFTVMAATTFLFRYPAGRLVDGFGPRRIAIPTAGAQVIGCVLAAYASGWEHILVAGACLGFAWSAVVPVGIALFFERSGSKTRGIAMGAYNLSFGIGAASGAFLAAICAALGGGYTLAMLISAAAPLAIVPFVAASKPPQRRVSPAAIAPAG